jgi:hypothetical protein
MRQMHRITNSALRRHILERLKNLDFSIRHILRVAMSEKLGEMQKLLIKYSEKFVTHFFIYDYILFSTCEYISSTFPRLVTSEIERNNFT